jgi:hypothetical protein
MNAFHNSSGTGRPSTPVRHSSASLAVKDHNLLLSLEGIDRTGKTEIVRAAIRALRKRGLPATSVTDPPKVAPWGNMKRNLFDKANSLAPISEAWLFLSARLDMVRREIVPAIDGDSFVIADRYVDSWVAYHAPRLEGHFGSIGCSVAFPVETQAPESDRCSSPFLELIREGRK